MQLSTHQNFTNSFSYKGNNSETSTCPKTFKRGCNDKKKKKKQTKVLCIRAFRWQKRFERWRGRAIRQEWSWLNAKIKCFLEALREARTRKLQFACFYAVWSLQQARTHVAKVGCFSYELLVREDTRMDKFIRRRSLVASRRVPPRLGEKESPSGSVSGLATLPPILTRNRLIESPATGINELANRRV